MPERLRILLERPLDPTVARAIVCLAAAIFAGLAVLWLLAGGGERTTDSERTAAGHPAPSAPSAPPESPLRPADPSSPAEPVHRARRGHHHHRRPVQDPQDRRGSAASRRAHHELRGHRALQYLPYRRGALRITLIGARGTRAVVRVSASTPAAARTGWRSFLHRYRDSGRAYLPRFIGRRTAGRSG